MSENKREEKNLYELGFLLKDEDVSPVKNLLEKYSAVSVTEGPVAKVNLAYPIKKNNQAFFGYVRFELDSRRAPDLEKELQIDGNFIRSLLIKLRFSKAVSEKSSMGGSETPFKPVGRRRELKGKTPILTNEALEKKIEEILK